MGLEQKGKTVEAKRSSRYGARTHDFFACGGPAHVRSRPSSAGRNYLAHVPPAGYCPASEYKMISREQTHAFHASLMGGRGSVLTKINMNR